MPHLPWNDIRDRAVRFAHEHAADRSEIADKQTFWNEFFTVFGLRRASLASFEENVKKLSGNTGFIDLLWKGKLLVEHKSRGEDLELAGTQAFTYIENLTQADRWEEVPRFVLVSDFARFVLYDLEPEEQLDLPLFAARRWGKREFTLAEFPKNVRAFAFMLGQTRARLRPEDPANEKAYARMGELHDALRAGGYAGHDLERTLVRILFCLFAEDTGIFDPEVFTWFVRHGTREDGSDVGARLNELFDWLNDPRADAPLEDTDPFYGFRYVNGGLFAERLRFPRFNRAMRDALLFCCDFQWSRISPAVFGSLFQGVLEDRARRQQGAHYTSERDILKVLRSLFLDDLRSEFERLRVNRSTRRRAELQAFHGRLRALQFLDPACGCGNFLVLAYRELRALEIEVVRELDPHAQQSFQTEDFSRLFGVNVDQFHGIELSEWPVRIAEVALWLMDHQMNGQVGEVFGQSVDRLPLKASPHIVHANALEKDWDEVLPRAECSYVLGNPPFVGKKEQNATQKADMARVWSGVNGAGVLDYVTAWYVKAARYTETTGVPVAFVSTNSISQGEQVGVLWREVFERYALNIHFAHRTFAWQSEARGKAHVHVVIIGFGRVPPTTRTIYEYENSNGEPIAVRAMNINGYLLDGPSVSVQKRMHPISPVPEMDFGSKAADFGHLVLSPVERLELLSAYPFTQDWIRPFLGSEEFINAIPRFCLWLKGASPAQLRQCPPVLERMDRCRQARLQSVDANTRRWAQFPALFQADRQPKTDYLVFPKVSSEKREYVPLGFMPPTFITNPSILVVPGATLYHFGALSSAMHMAWMRQVCGRMKSDYQYSNTIVYNNFPWPHPVTEQGAAVEEKARAVLDARAPHLPPHGTSTLADLYDPLTMPAELRRAHADLDRAVERCYRVTRFATDRERVEHLFLLLGSLTSPLLPALTRPRRQRRLPTPEPPRPPKAGRLKGFIMEPDFNVPLEDFKEYME